jgi:hypothetical protein
MTDDDKTEVLDLRAVSEASLALARLALRLAEAAKRYADAACHIDGPGADEVARLWETEKDLESLGELVHGTRQRMIQERRDRQGRRPTMETPHTPHQAPRGPTEPPEELPPPPESIPDEEPPVPPGDPRPGLDGRE